MTFGDKLKQLRTAKRLTQADIAMRIGVTRRTYVSYEQEGRYPRKREVYNKLAEILGCDVNYLMTEDEYLIPQINEHHDSKGKRQAEELTAELSGIFAGGELSDTDMIGVMTTLQQAYLDFKEDKKKYNPNKYTNN